MFRQRIAAIVAKLDSARALPIASTIFGAQRHQFRLAPPLAESDLLAFEQLHAVALPSDYRQFLLLAGNGGAGPAYGIAPLSEWNYWFEEESEEPGFLASPCPLVDGPALIAAWNAARERGRLRSQGLSNPGPPDLPYPGTYPDWARGTVHLSDQGCTYSARLIVSGPARGRVVNFDVQGWNPPCFAHDRCFLDWYERWLDQILAGNPALWFGFDNPDYSA